MENKRLKIKAPQSLLNYTNKIFENYENETQKKLDNCESTIKKINYLDKELLLLELKINQDEIKLGNTSSAIPSKKIRILENFKDFYIKVRNKEIKSTYIDKFYKSFLYTGGQKDFQISRLYSKLKKGYLSENTKKEDFLKLFTNKVLNNYIIWEKDDAELCYLIKLLFSKLQIRPHTKWKIVHRWFRNKYNEEYVIRNLKTLKPPHISKRSDIDSIFNYAFS